MAGTESTKTFSVDMFRREESGRCVGQGSELGTSSTTTDRAREGAPRDAIRAGRLSVRDQNWHADLLLTPTSNMPHHPVCTIAPTTIRNPTASV
jgi:hypothetical protein